MRPEMLALIVWLVALQITLEVSPRVLLWRDGVEVHAHWAIVPHGSNRWYSLAWTNAADVSGVMVRELEGAEAARIYDRWIRIGPGWTLVTACVYRLPSRRWCQAVDVEAH